MVCRTCGAPLADDPTGAWCPRCSFEHALFGAPAGAGGRGEGHPMSPDDAYELLHELGRGTMGVVWLARERALDRLVALKISAPGAAAGWGARLLREGRVAASLRHPHIVAVFASGGEESQPFLAMEFIEGGGLDGRLREQPMPFREAAAIAEKLAGALAFAHGAGVLHRDVKPSNIMMDELGEPHLADFGLAAHVAGSGDLTLPGHVVGTPAYLAPEILGGASMASPASDIYGLGAVLYACITGRAPFVGESAGSILAQLPAAEPPPPHLLRPAVPRDLETICLKCLEKSPERLYASASRLEADLEAYLDGRPIAARPLGWHGRLARSCRRHPAFATSVAATVLCLLALAIGGPVMAFRLSRAQSAAEDRLREALLARSRETRIAAQVGGRDEALAATAEAARIRPGLDARDEAIAALTRPEAVPVLRWTTRLNGQGSLTFDPDHRQFALDTKPGTVEVRRMDDGKVLQTWTGPPQPLWSALTFSRDGLGLVARNEKGDVIVWKAGQAEPRFILVNRPYVLTGRFRGYGQPDAFSPDGEILASALPSHGVSLHRADNGEEIRRIATDTEATHVEFSGDGKWLAIGRGLLAHDGSFVAFVHIHDVATGELVSQLRLEKGFQTVRWAPEGDLVLVAGDRLDLYHGRDGKLVRSINDPGAVHGFFGPQASTLIGVDLGGTMTLWDQAGGRPLLAGPLGSNPEIAVDRSGELIAKSLGDDNARLFRLEMSRVARTWPSGPGGEHENVLSAAVPVVDFSPDGHWLATALWGYIQLRDGTGRLVDSAKRGLLSNYVAVRFAPDGQSILAGTQEEGLLRFPLVEAAGGGRKLGPPRVVDPENGFFITDISRDGTRALETNFVEGVVKVIQLDGSPSPVRWKLPGAAGAVFLNQGRDVLANSLESEGGAKLQVRNAQTGAVERTLPYPHGAHASQSADGSLLVLGVGPDGTVQLRPSDWSRGAGLPTPVQGREEQCAVAPDAQAIAFGVGNRVWLVRAADGAVLAHLEGAQGGSYIPGLAYSPDGTHLALLWETGALTMWDLEGLRAELRSRGLDW